MLRSRVLDHIIAVSLTMLITILHSSNGYAEEQKTTVGSIFDDCEGKNWCPKMVVLKGGVFMMGASVENEGSLAFGSPKYMPARKVIIGSFAVGQFEITRMQFDIFVKETGYKIENNCLATGSRKGAKSYNHSYLRPGYSQDNKHPVVCVNWFDAQAYVKWLSGKTSRKYRLLTEAEWEYVARIGTKAMITSTRFFFGINEADLCQYDNIADISTGFSWSNKNCSDSVGKKTAPVGSYKSNKFGIYDIYGNVAEWVQDHYLSTGSSRTGGDRSSRVIRGGAWGTPTLGATKGLSGDPSVRTSVLGFRVARDL